MNAFYNLKIATKLVLSFTAVLLLTAFLGIFALLQLAPKPRHASPKDQE